MTAKVPVFIDKCFPIKCKKSPNGLHQCDCPTGEMTPRCQYCGDFMYD